MAVLPETLPPGFEWALPKPTNAQKTRWRKQQLKYLIQAIEYFGNRTRMAEALGVHQQTPYQWYRLKRISVAGALKVHALNIGITREQLRPDIKDWNAEILELQKKEQNDE